MASQRAAAQRRACGRRRERVIMNKPSMRIAVLHFSHETVTFLPNDTTLEDFIYPGLAGQRRGAAASRPRSPTWAASCRWRANIDGVELVGITSPFWPKTGTGSGWITQTPMNALSARMIAEIKAGRPFDGVYLCVHGAMAVRGRAPARRPNWRGGCGEAVGPDACIAATFDLARQRGRSVPRARRHGVRGQIFPALRRLPARRACGANAGAGDPRRLQARPMSR